MLRLANCLDLVHFSCLLLLCVALPQLTVKPQVTSLEPNQTLNDGSDAFFYCEAVAYPTAITYNWFKDGSQIASNPNGNYLIEPSGSQSRLRVKQIKKNSAGRYSCSGTNTEGTGQQASVFLKVNYAPQNVTVTDAKPLGVKRGESTTLTCYADGFPAPSFSWKFNGNVVSGAQQSTLVLTNAKVEDAGNYTCVASNFRGSKEFRRLVHVRCAPTHTTFTTGTPGNAVVQGTTVTLTCSAKGYPVPQYTIKHNDVTLQLQSNNPGTFVINNIQLSHEDYTYSCVPRNAEGIGTEATLTIIVQVPPSFSGQSLPTTKVTKNENQTQSYSCTADAKPFAQIQWVLNGQNLTHTPPYSISTSFQPIQNSKLSKTLSYLTISPLSWRQNGSYSCIAYNPAGQVRQKTELEIRYRPVVQFASDHPKNLTLEEGATATFTCKTIGNPPTTSHKWQFNGVDIPGADCANCISTTYRKTAVTQLDAGWYSCIGTNIIGDGPPASAQLLIKRPPQITRFPQSLYTVNKTNNVTMVCGAEGVPVPEIIWVKISNGKEIGKGEDFTIPNTSGSDDGRYICTAKNYLGSDSREVTLNVQTRPTIITSFPMATNIPGAAGEDVKLTCIVSAKPSAQLAWKRNLNANDLSALNDGEVKSISSGANSIEMTVTVAAINKEFYCVAVNLLGSDSQLYRIRKRGPPDSPQDVKLVSFQVPDAKTVSVNVSWTPGYNGGFRQEFSILYRRKTGGADFKEESVGNPPNNMHTVQKLRPNTDYEFRVQAFNERGVGPGSSLVQVMTPVSAIPPDRGTVKATRSSNVPTVIIVTWTVTDEIVTKLSLEIQEGGNSAWEAVIGATDMSTFKSEFKVKNTKAHQKYKFRMDMRRPGEEGSCLPCYVYSNTVTPRGSINVNEKITKREGLSAAQVSGIVVGILLAILLAICFYILWIKRRGKITRKRFAEPNESDLVTYVNDAVQFDFGSSTDSSTVPERNSAQPVYNEIRELKEEQKVLVSGATSAGVTSEYQMLDRTTMDWEIAPHQVSIIKIIGKGAFGQVAKATAMNVQGMHGLYTVAVKMLKDNASESEIEAVKSELEIMKKLKPHPHVIKLLGCVTKSDPLMVLIEYVPYGDLLGYLKKSRGLNDTSNKNPDVEPQTTLTSQQLIKFAWEIADGMSFLASNNIIHRDLAARNVLVGENTTCKVANFGMARENDYERKTGGRLPVKWTAYEALVYGHYTPKSDVWSYGVVLYEIFTVGGCPYPDMDGHDVVAFLKEGGRMAKPKYLDDHLYLAMQDCWKEEPQERPSFQLLKVMMEKMQNAHMESFSWEQNDESVNQDIDT